MYDDEYEYGNLENNDDEEDDTYRNEDDQDFLETTVVHLSLSESTSVPGKMVPISVTKKTVEAIPLKNDDEAEFNLNDSGSDVPVSTAPLTFSKAVVSDRKYLLFDADMII
jgi:hypothetical protein